MTGNQKECFGILDKVFPMVDQDLRQIAPACFDCTDRIGCLKSALDTEKGLEFRANVMDRFPATGLAGRLRRWSDKKDLDRRLKKVKGNKKWI